MIANSMLQTQQPQSAEASTEHGKIAESMVIDSTVWIDNFDDSDADRFLEAAMIDIEAKLLLVGLGAGQPPVYISPTMVDYIIDWTLSDKMKLLFL